MKEKTINLLRIIYVLCMIVGISAFFSTNVRAEQEEPEPSPSVSWEGIKTQIEQGNGEVNILDITGDVTVTSSICIDKNQKVVIQGNVNFYRDSDFSGPFFDIQSGELTIRGNSGDEDGRLKFYGSGENGKSEDSRFANIGLNGSLVIDKHILITNFQTSQHGNVIYNSGSLCLKSTLIEGNQNDHDDIYQNGTMKIDCAHDEENLKHPTDIDLHIFITKPRKTEIISNIFCGGFVSLDISNNMNVGDQLIKVHNGVNSEYGAGGFEKYFTKTKKGVFETGKGFVDFDYLSIKDDGIYLDSEIKSEFGYKPAIYSGKIVNVDMPDYLLGEDYKNVLKVTYYKDSSLKNQTTQADGCNCKGGAPANVGTYYAVISLQGKKRGLCKLEIKKAKGDIAVNNKMFSLVENNNANIVITENVGNLSYNISSSNPDVIQVSQSNGAVACKALKCGISTITITTNGNRNVTSSSVKVTVKAAPAQIVIKKASSTGKGKMSVQWKVSNTATGYNFQYARDSKFKKKLKTISVLCSKAKKGKGNAKNLKRKAKYYVRIRAYYQAPNGEKLYGQWSKKKKVKIK